MKILNSAVTQINHAAQQAKTQAKVAGAIVKESLLHPKGDSFIHVVGDKVTVTRQQASNKLLPAIKNLVNSLKGKK